MMSPDDVNNFLNRAARAVVLLEELSGYQYISVKTYNTGAVTVALNSALNGRCEAAVAVPIALWQEALAAALKQVSR